MQSCNSHNTATRIVKLDACLYPGIQVADYYTGSAGPMLMPIYKGFMVVWLIAVGSCRVKPRGYNKASTNGNKYKRITGIMCSNKAGQRFASPIYVFQRHHKCKTIFKQNTGFFFQGIPAAAAA